MCVKLKTLSIQFVGTVGMPSKKIKQLDHNRVFTTAGSAIVRQLIFAGVLTEV